MVARVECASREGWSARVARGRAKGPGARAARGARREARARHVPDWVLALDAQVDVVRKRLLTGRAARLVEAESERLAIRVRLPHVQRVVSSVVGSTVRLVAGLVDGRRPVHEQHRERGEAPPLVVVGCVDGHSDRVVDGL